jgi:hypothetical protein
MIPTRPGRAFPASRRFVACLALVLLLGTAVSVTAQDAVTEVTRRELVELVNRSRRGDAEARRTLEGIRRVDGRPVDLGAALEGAEGGELDRRLRELLPAPGAAGPSVSPDEAQGDAEEILRSPRYTGNRRVGPVARLLERVTEWVGDVLGRLTRPLGEALAGLDPAVWLLIGLLVMAVATGVVLRLAKRRARDVGDGPRRPVSRRGVSPDELERQAGTAEAAGDFATALRLHFAAGLLRLERAGTLPTGSVPNALLAVRLRSDDFRALALDFDRVVYGRHPATPADLDAARARWPRVLEGAASR